MYCFVLDRVNVEEKCNGWQLPSDRRLIVTERSDKDCGGRGEGWQIKYRAR